MHLPPIISQKLQSCAPKRDDFSTLKVIKVVSFNLDHNCWFHFEGVEHTHVLWLLFEGMGSLKVLNNLATAPGAALIRDAKMLQSEQV